MRDPKRKTQPLFLASRVEETIVKSAPPHLVDVNWLEHERQTISAVFKDLRKELRKLKAKVNEDNVHKSRVTLRRWHSVWEVLAQDDWESKKFRRDIGKTLRALQKALGRVRDFDVNIEQGRRLGMTEPQLKDWIDERDKAQKKLKKSVDNADINGILKQLDKYLEKRHSKVESKLSKPRAESTAFEHLEVFLIRQESVVRQRADSAQTPDEYHGLRLAIKSWRYLLTEFFGTTNLELVRAQQILGQMHDLDRLTPLLSENEDLQEPFYRLRQRRRDLLRQIEEMCPQLPYGLRPQIVSVERSNPANFGSVRR